MEAARAEEAPLIPLTNGSMKKKFRARKTMTASCRQQLATLKLKNSSKCGNALKETPNKSVQQSEIICETNFTAQDNSASKITKSQGVFHNGLKVSIEVSQVDSGINIGCSYNEDWKEISEKSPDLPFSHTTHFLVHDFNAAAAESHFTDLGPVPSPTDSDLQVSSKDALQIAESALVQDVKAACEQADIKCSAISENLNASITLKIIDEDQSFKKTSSIDIVTPVGLTDSDRAAEPQNEPDPSNCTTDGHTALASPSDFTAVSELVHPEHEDAAGGDGQRKRTCSESSDVPEAKRAKTSSRVLLDEIQGLIDKRINILFKDLFDQRIQTLTRQADSIQRNGSRTNDISRHLRSIKRLQRRLKCAAHLQRQLGTCSTNLTTISSPPEKLHNADVSANASRVLPPAEAAESLPETPSAPNPPTSRADLVVLSDNEPEQPSNPECPKNGSKKVDSAAMQKIMKSIMEHRKRGHSSKTGKKVKAVIDLTDDEQKSDKDVKTVTEHRIPNGGVSVSSPKENISDENVFDKYSVKKDPASRSNTEAPLSCDVSERKPSIPISPQSENLHKSVASIKTSSSPEPTLLKPPQKPQLRLAQVQNPKGIALSWNITHVDPSCAPAKTYCLYVHQGDPNNPKKLWKKIPEINALPLPMACTLTQFVEDNTYSFAMRAKDANGRFGPLCDIQSTTLKSLGSSKKS